MPNHHEIQEHDPNHYPRGHDPTKDAILNVLYFSFPVEGYCIFPVEGCKNCVQKDRHPDKHPLGRRTLICEINRRQILNLEQ